MPTVFVVDEDPALARLLTNNLRSQGYMVEAFNAGQPVLNELARSTPDLVLLDIKMQGMEGLEVLRQLRGFSQVPVIIVTALDATKTMMNAFDLGADDYLTKPLIIDVLSARIRAILKRTSIPSNKPHHQGPHLDPSQPDVDQIIQFLRDTPHPLSKRAPEAVAMLEQLLQRVDERSEEEQGNMIRDASSELDKYIYG